LNLERIVAVVEFSPHGTVVLAQALALARWHDATLDVVSVARQRRLGRTQTVTGSHSTLVDFVAQSQTGEVPVSAFVLEGRPTDSIARHVTTRPAQLIVMGQGGWHVWSRRRLVPSVARRTRLPVLTIPRRASIDSIQTNFRRIVCAVDDSAVAAGALQMALHLGQESDGQVTVLHVVEGFPFDSVYSAASVPRLLAEFDRRAMRIVQRLRTLVPLDALHWCDVDYRVVPGLAHHTIASVAAGEGADLVVVGSQPRHWLDLTAATVVGVLARAECPVLTVPGQPDLTAKAGRQSPGVEVVPDAASDTGAQPGAMASVHA
jgi:nucleotide-binding universal stress UspA family protein